MTTPSSSAAISRPFIPNPIVSRSGPWAGSSSLRSRPSFSSNVRPSASIAAQDLRALESLGQRR